VRGSEHAGCQRQTSALDEPRASRQAPGRCLLPHGKAGVFGSSDGTIDNRLAVARQAYRWVGLLAAFAA
jgi:hypothetical protein